MGKKINCMAMPARDADDIKAEFCTNDPLVSNDFPIRLIVSPGVFNDSICPKIDVHGFFGNLIFSGDVVITLKR
jgi:hypothetical protein